MYIWVNIKMFHTRKMFSYIYTYNGNKFFSINIMIVNYKFDITAQLNYVTGHNLNKKFQIMFYRGRIFNSA